MGVLGSCCPCPVSVHKCLLWNMSDSHLGFPKVYFLTVFVLRISSFYLQDCFNATVYWMFTMHMTSTVLTSSQILSQLQFSECFKSKQKAEDHPLWEKRKKKHSGDPGDTFQGPVPSTKLHSEEHLWFHFCSSLDFLSLRFPHPFIQCLCVYLCKLP